jgi:hypothetical protein
MTSPRQHPRGRSGGLTRAGLLTLWLTVLASAGCHELGNPVTRTTQRTPFPAEPPHQTITRVTYAHASEAVAWRRPPAHALDRGLPNARYIARIDVTHPPGPAGGRVRLATTVVFQDGTRRTIEWLAPSDATVWSADVALPSQPARALTQVLR